MPGLHIDKGMKLIGCLLTMLCLLSYKPPLETDYREVFGSDYTWAVEWLNNKGSVIDEYASAFNIPANELKAIVFPELIRYNGFINILEVESLKFLYVTEGKDYADFSVGYFQMKPSFAEMIEADGIATLPRKYSMEAGWAAPEADERTVRKQRVQRLSNTRQQLIYLCAFYKLCEKRFRKIKFASAEDRIRLFSTCYNAGYKHSYKTLLQFQTRLDFMNYNYSAVCVNYYREL